MNWVTVPFPVQKPEIGERVDRFLARRLHRYSRAQVQRLIDDGRVELRGRKVKAASRVADGDTVLIRYERRPEEPARHARLEVLFEDDRVLAVAKPGDVLSHPTDKVVNNTVTSILKSQFPGRRLHLVHRLDRETSGVLLLAKDREAAAALVDAFTLRKTLKEYVALVMGRAPARATVRLAIGREGGEIKVRQAVRAEGGDDAVTSFKRLAAGPNASLVLALPKTGRLHQIRVHLAHLGYPIVGDKLYTGEGEAYLKACRHALTPEETLATLGASRQMLHARKLTVPHPATGKRLVIEAPLPDDFKDAARRLGLTA